MLLEKEKLEKKKQKGKHTHPSMVVVFVLDQNKAHKKNTLTIFYYNSLQENPTMLIDVMLTL